MDTQDLAKDHPGAAAERFPTLPRRTFMRVGIAASVLLVAGVAGIYTTSRRTSPDLVAEIVSDYLTFRASAKNSMWTINGRNL